MDALKIALETVFVGVLALPWLALASQLFFPKFSLSRMGDFEGWLPRLWSIKNEAIGYAVVGLLSVAMAYTLGATISRLAQDFFNDDDLQLHSPTEDQIRASVYCEHTDLGMAEIGIPVLDDLDPCPFKQGFGSLWGRDESLAIDWAHQVFSLQETALLLQGEDKVSRLRTLHQQIMVLRGATFNGLLTWVLCMIGWSAKRSSKPWRWVLPIALVLYALHALLWNHLSLLHADGFKFEFDDPGFMEITLLLLGAGGCYAAYKGATGLWPQGTGWVSLLFTALAYSGWYWSEILYDRLVTYSFYAAHNHLLNLTQ
jgi:hypothetical protein